MCLAIPGKVVAIDTERQLATVDYEAERREAGTHLVELALGDYVLVQAKMVVQVVPKEEAEQALAALRERAP